MEAVDQEKLKKLIFQRRTELKISQVNLAKIVGVSHVMISNWENGKHIVSPDHYEKLAFGLQMTKEKMLGHKPKDIKMIKDSQKIFYSTMLFNLLTSILVSIFVCMPIIEITRVFPKIVNGIVVYVRETEVYNIFNAENGYMRISMIFTAVLSIMSIIILILKIIRIEINLLFCIILNLMILFLVETSVSFLDKSATYILILVCLNFCFEIIYIKKYHNLKKKRLEQ